MSLAEKEGFIWYDGKLVPWKDATVHVLAHGLHYGTSVFEGVRCYEGTKGAGVFRLKEHNKRFFQSAHILGMKIPFTPEEIEQAYAEVIIANNLTNCYIRPLAFYGANQLGIAAQSNPVHVIIAAWPWGAYLGEEALEKGIRVKISSFSRMHVNSNMCLGKIGGHYVNSVLAHTEAATDGYDEALLLDVNGLLAEGAGENLFIISHNKIYTPALTSVLNGITRDTILTLAKDNGYDVIESSLTRDALYCADEAFFTGTAAEVTPIREVDNRQIGDGKRGPITKRLQDDFFSAIRGNNKNSDQWLTYINKQ